MPKPNKYKIKNYTPIVIFIAIFGLIGWGVFLFCLYRAAFIDGGQYGETRIYWNYFGEMWLEVVFFSFIFIAMLYCSILILKKGILK